jgi:cohesin complex subunit SCC1
MEMQRNGTFVSNLLGDGYLRGWAPELRGILSLEIIRKAGEKKRKRDSGVADLEMEEDEDRQATPQLDIPQDEDDYPAQGAPTPAPLMYEDDLPLEDETLRNMDDMGNNTFDVTEAPLLHPAQSGPVAIGTKKMVHLLREHFAPGHSESSTGEAPTPSKRTQSSALFTDICPEGRTSRVDATKMFFELLVLGTKDAIKVEQSAGEVGAPLRVRGKRGLWGNWAEMGTGGTQAESQAQAVEAAA